MRLDRHLSLSLAVLLAGCGTSKSGPTPGPNPHPAEKPAVSALEQVGAYTPARPQAVLLGAARPIAIVGLVGVRTEVEGLFAPPVDGTEVHGGLSVLDTNTGSVRTFTSADGLPLRNYQNEFDHQPVPGTAPIFDLSWLAPDEAFVAAAWSHVVVGTFAGDGLSFRSATLRAPGAGEDASVSRVAAAGGEIFAATDQGVAVLDPATLDVARWLDLGPAWAMDLSAGDLGGPAVAVSVATPGAPAASRLVLARPGSASVEDVTLPDGARPTAIAGADGAFWIGLQGADGRGLVHALTPRVHTTLLVDDSLRTDAVIGADALAVGAAPGKPFVPARIAVDEVHGRLLVGGSISSTTPGASGGVLSFPIEFGAPETIRSEPLLDRRWGDAALLPWQVEVLVSDARGRVWIAGRQLCNERKPKVTGLFRIEGVGNDARLARPIVSGVRAVTTDPVHGHTWLALRDEIPGMACDGVNVQQSICRLKSDGSCEVYTPRVNADESFFPTDVGASDIAFGDPARRELAIATSRDATFLRKGDQTHAIPTQFEPGINLRQTRASWGTSGLWLGSISEWSEMPDPEIDWEKVNDRSPHGLGYLELDDAGRTTLLRRYVRVPSDSSDHDVGGLPSNTVWDVLPLDGDRQALVALGVERWDTNYDHLLPEPTATRRGGGIARVNGDEVTAFGTPRGMVWGDVMGLAKGGEAIFAVDADAGVFRIETGHAIRFADAAWAPARATSIAANADGWVAVGTTEGLWLFDADGAGQRVGDATVGRVWSLRFATDRLLHAGTDQGLVRVALNDTALPERGPQGPLDRTVWQLDLGCDGGPGCACLIDEQCAWGSACDCSAPSVCACLVTDLPTGDACLEDCTCPVVGGCLDGYECVRVIGGRQTCEAMEPPRDACLDDCSCEFDGGCPDGFSCDGEIGAGSCVEDVVPHDPCLDDCSCGGPDTCPDGWTCQSGIAGQSCIPN